MSPSHRTLSVITGAVALALLGATPGAPEPTPRWAAPIALATGGGVRGPWRQNESDFRYVDDPTVAIAPRGGVAVAWVDQARKDVLFQALGPDGRPRRDAPGPVNVSRSPAVFSWLPRIAIDARVAGRIYVLWQEIVFSGGSHGGEAFFARSLDGGRSFGALMNLSRSMGGDGKGRIDAEVWHNGSHDLAQGPDGALLAVWTEYHGALWWSRSDDGGETFSTPRSVAGDERSPARGPSLAVAPGGRIFLAWTVGEDAAADVRVAASDDGGASFGAPVTVARTAGHSDAPKLVISADGALHVVYTERAAGPFARGQVHHARSTDGGRTFAPPRAISKPPPDGAAGASYPAIDVDGAGALYVLWELERAQGASPRGLALAISRDAGRSFAAPALVPGSADPFGVNGSLQGRLMDKLAVGRAGEVAVVNSSFREGDGSRVWLVRGGRGGRAR
jgi:hypothetical protein